jgi:hypothetical protein
MDFLIYKMHTLLHKNSVVCTRRFYRALPNLYPELYVLTLYPISFSNYRSYYNKEPEQCCMTDHRIKNNPLSSFENKQRSVSNISYMVFFPYRQLWVEIGRNRNYSAILVTLQITSYALGV